MTTTASDPDAVVVVLTTVDSEAAGLTLARLFVDEGLVNIIGGCCGTTPAHIQAIAAAVRQTGKR